MRIEKYAEPGLVTKVAKVIPESVREALATVAISYNMRRKPCRSFVFNGQSFDYFFHAYNLAWRNERTVEIPIMLEMIRAEKGEILEVGNVLSHYVDVGHDVIDKYELAEGIINEDAGRYHPDKKYGLIVSVSTLEHIGRDEYPRDPEKILRVISNLRDLLAPGGILAATAPIGLNPEFDRLVEQKVIPFTEARAMKRCSRKNDWEESDYDSVKTSGYNRFAYRARAIVIGFIQSADEKAN